MSGQTTSRHRKPATEEYIRAQTVGELKPLTGPIVLADYDSGWPRLFQREADRVASLLGATALRIEHIGSTSVPGLAAKPIIDMLLVVADSAREEMYVPALEAAGYVIRIREPDWYAHRMLREPDANVNLHVFSSRCPEIDRVLLFRDWLRISESDRERYARAKRELAKQTWKYTQQYADAKTGVIEEIIARAHEAWPDRR